jgi:ATP-dependent RNA helicase DDX18/HAS1
MLQLEKLIGKNYFLNLSAKEAYKAYVRAYDSHHLKQIFDVETLDLAKVAASFGFQVPPAVDLRILCTRSVCEERTFPVIPL